MIARNRTGLWVRNGFAICAQLLRYRDFMLRELSYDQDLYFISDSVHYPQSRSNYRQYDGPLPPIPFL